MASSIKHIVEPALGWLFIVAVIIGVAAALVVDTESKVEITGRVPVERPH